MRPALLVAVSLGGLGILSAAVSCSSATCEDKGTCAAADGSVVEDGGDSGPPIPPGCDANADPKDAPKCVVNEFGVFVDANGNDANPGTKESPVKTISGALGKLAGKTRVYVCDGAYTETIDLKTTASIFGGFACGAWTASGAKAKVTAKAVGEYALRIASATGALVVSDLEFTALAGNETSLSSITAFISDSPNVTLRRLKLVAGPGAKGKEGDAATSGVSNPPDLTGAGGSTASGGAAKTCVCTSGGTSVGAKGGDPGVDGNKGETAFASPSPGSATGEGGKSADCASSSGQYVVGRVGSNAPDAESAKAPSTIAIISADGLKGTGGENGTNGKPGQGGGGGGGVVGASAGGGGAGGCGGCGGFGGRGGPAGGSSIGLLLLNSPITVTASEIASSAAADGALGRPGAPGVAGGTRGNGGGGACQGGNGGGGGAGGAGAGGSGGISAGILHNKGIAPKIDDATRNGTAIGPAGIGGTGGNGTNNGLNGVAEKIVEL